MSVELEIQAAEERLRRARAERDALFTEAVNDRQMSFRSVATVAGITHRTVRRIVETEPESHPYRHGGVVFTIGYQGRTGQQLVSELKRCGVDLLIDVRERPFSRKPDFRKTALAETLSQSGIDYRHEPRLGNPKTNRAGFGSTDRQTRARAHDQFEAAAITVGGDAALDEILDLARTHRIALLCYERCQHDCHRGVVIEMMLRKVPTLSVRQL